MHSLSIRALSSVAASITLAEIFPLSYAPVLAVETGVSQPERRFRVLMATVFTITDSRTQQTGAVEVKV